MCVLVIEPVVCVCVCFGPRACVNIQEGRGSELDTMSVAGSD